MPYHKIANSFQSTRCVRWLTLLVRWHFQLLACIVWFLVNVPGRLNTFKSFHQTVASVFFKSFCPSRRFIALCCFGCLSQSVGSLKIHLNLYLSLHRMLEKNIADVFCYIFMLIFRRKMGMFGYTTLPSSLPLSFPLEKSFQYENDFDTINIYIISSWHWHFDNFEPPFFGPFLVPPSSFFLLCA